MPQARLILWLNVYLIEAGFWNGPPPPTMEYMNLILHGLLTTLNSITSTPTMTPNVYLVTWSPGVAAHLKTKYCTLPVCIPFGSISKMGRFLNIWGDLPHHLFNYIIFYPGTCINIISSYEDLLLEDAVEILKGCAKSFPVLSQPSLVRFFFPFDAFSPFPAGSTLNSERSLRLHWVEMEHFTFKRRSLAFAPSTTRTTQSRNVILLNFASHSLQYSGICYMRTFLNLKIRPVQWLEVI